MSTYVSGSGEKGPWCWEQTTPLVGSENTKLKFYEYKYIRHILMSIIDFQEKNRSEESIKKMPYFVHEIDPNYVKKLIDKMTARMKEFEPDISKNTTCHTGYWEV